MKRLRLISFTWGCLFGLTLIFFMFTLITNGLWSEYYLAIVMSMSLLMGSILLGLWIRAYHNLALGKLIWGNQILKVPAVFSDGIDISGLKTVVSGFGILMKDRVIPFNQGGARLQSIVIRANSMDIIYGTGGESHEVNLSFQNFNEKEIKDIVDKFRFETGIEPIFWEENI